MDLLLFVYLSFVCPHMSVSHLSSWWMFLLNIAFYVQLFYLKTWRMLFLFNFWLPSFLFRRKLSVCYFTKGICFFYFDRSWMLSSNHTLHLNSFFFHSLRKLFHIFSYLQTSSLSPIFTLNWCPCSLLHWENWSNQQRTVTGSLIRSAHLPARLLTYCNISFTIIEKTVYYPTEAIPTTSLSSSSKT